MDVGPNAQFNCSNVRKRKLIFESIIEREFKLIINSAEEQNKFDWSHLKRFYNSHKSALSRLYCLRIFCEFANKVFLKFNCEDYKLLIRIIRIYQLVMNMYTDLDLCEYCKQLHIFPRHYQLEDIINSKSILKLVNKIDVDAFNYTNREFYSCLVTGVVYVGDYAFLLLLIKYGLCYELEDPLYQVKCQLCILMARYSIIAGTVGFLGGLYFKNDFLYKRNQVLAATNVVVPSSNDEPMEIDDPVDYVSTTMQFGFPSFETLRSRKSYVLSYDRRNRVPNWVFEHLTPSHVAYNENVNRIKSEFFEDSSIHHYFRSTNSDYKGSGYDRGHLAAAGNHRSSQEYLDDTFVLSNISPQVGKGFNRDAWNNLEKHVRKLVKEYKNVYVCTGPLYLPKYEPDGKKYVKYEVIGNNNVAVPTHFFKVIVGETVNNEFDLEAYVMPNAPIDDSVPLKSFLVPKDTIERAAGFLLFEKLSPTSFRRINGLKT